MNGEFDGPDDMISKSCLRSTPARLATSHMRPPKTPLTQTITSSPGSTRLATQVSIPLEPVPGMAEIYHCPAAGLLSSVTDLAAFDIALDRGLLLKPETQAQMFTPAYSTYQGRADLQYGLGWYVQDFDGLRLLWHTGRWPPSTGRPRPAT